jgi:glycosyltransferase involved in cell wall biosynthesis
MSIGLVANVYNEANALPGWLETHLPFFDDVCVYHAGPQGAYSNDGTIELLEKWRIPVTFGSIDAGFGAVRTAAMRASPCEYVMVLDADERFFPVVHQLVCEGAGMPQSEVDAILQSYDFRGVNLPNWENVGRLGSDLRVSIGEPYDQGKLLRDTLHADAVMTCRRHWHDLSLRRPTQSWTEHPDWQARIVRNDNRIRFEGRMHEQLHQPVNMVRSSLFFDHFHFTFKRMEQKQRAHDILIYDAVHAGRVPPLPGA